MEQQRTTMAIKARGKAKAGKVGKARVRAMAKVKLKPNPNGQNKANQVKRVMNGRNIKKKNIIFRPEWCDYVEPRYCRCLCRRADLVSVWK